MNTAIEQLRTLVMEGKEYIPNREVRTFTLLQELTFIEQRSQANYLLAMHRFLKELRSLPDALIGPGYGWPIASHVCRTLCISKICLGFGLSPVDFWGNADSDTTIDIEVNEGSFALAYFKAVEVFGFGNVARTVERNDILVENDSIMFHGCRNKLKGFSVVVCPDGVANHYKVYEVKGEDGVDILYIDGDVKPTGNIHVFRFNVIYSDTLTRIKQIQQEIIKADKECPELYLIDNGSAFYYSDGYQTLFDDNDKGLPFFGDNLFKKLANILFDEILWMEDLLTIAALYHSRQIYEIHEYNLEDFKKKHGVVRLFDKWELPYGFLYRENVCWFLTGCVGMTWKQSAQVIQLMTAKKQPDTENLKHIYLHHGMDNGFNEGELNRTWDSLFNRPSKHPLPSMAHYAGLMYQYAYLAKLKKDFPEEYQTIKDKYHD